jgi:hypothetical protein
MNKNIKPSLENGWSFSFLCSVDCRYFLEEHVHIDEVMQRFPNQNSEAGMSGGKGLLVQIKYAKIIYISI